MVKFGRHLQFFLENEHQGSSLYIVPYNDIRASIHDTDVFLQQWNDALERACTDFRNATIAWWRRIFEGIAHLTEESRGALPEVAVRLYISLVDDDELQELLSITKQLHSTSLTNAEALRKLIKKFDKEHFENDDEIMERLSITLLPRVYAANFTVGQSTLEAALVVLRTQLHMDDDEEEQHHHDKEEEVLVGDGILLVDNDEGELCLESEDCLPATEATTSATLTTTKTAPPLSYLTARRETSRHEDAVQLRKAELEWLKILLKSIPPSVKSHIVAHRGFHNPRDRSDRRPLENSLGAYETAWTHGIHLCECDIALTKDEKLVLAHDEDFSRLALDPSDANSSVKVRDLTFRQLLSLPLKSGTRPPLLMDVLRSACEIGNGSQLIIEIKPGNSDAATALARMFLKYPQLLPAVAVVMSFDAFAMHNLRREMTAVMDALVTEDPHTLSARHRRQGSIPTSMSFGNFSIAQNLNLMGSSPSTTTSTSKAIGIPQQQQQQQHQRQDSLRGSESGDNIGMWLTESVGNRNESFIRPPSSGGILIPPPSPSMLKRKPSVEKYLSTSPTTTTTMSPNMSSSSLRRRRPSMDRSRGSLVSKYGAPKLMLLTVADKPKIPCELWVDVADLNPVDDWLHSHDGSLDGVYLQFQKSMMSQNGAASLRKLSEKYTVGIWGHNGRDPDDWETFYWLVRECGVSYVNSDLPKGFKRIFRHAATTLT